MRTFKLYHQQRYLGDMTFHRGTYIFRLNEDITLEEWNNRYGILPLNDREDLKNTHLFDQLNLRLPLQLRKEKDDKKIKYIGEQHLKVISDSYEFIPA